MGRRAGVGGRVDVCAKESHKKEEARGGESTGLGRSPFGSFCTSISLILKMSHRFCDTPDAVNNNVQIGMAARSHHLPNPWPWPTRWG